MMYRRVFQRLKEHQFMFEELVNRDFKQKYKPSAMNMKSFLDTKERNIENIDFTRLKK